MPHPSQYRSLSGEWVDSEKQRHPRNWNNHHNDDNDNDSSPSSYASSRDTSASYMPMLGGKPKSAPTYAYHLPRRRFTRYFTLSITALLLVFFFYLARSTAVSREAVRLGIKAPPSPPAFENFPFLKRYHGGIRTLVDRKDNVVEYPLDDEAMELQRLKEAALLQKQSEEKELEGEKGFQKREASWLDRATRFEVGEGGDDAPVKCYLDPKHKVSVPGLLAYRGVPQGFPDPVMGSHDLFGLRSDVCFERYGRLGPYGYGYSRRYGGSGSGLEGHREGSDLVWGDEAEIDYKNVDWAAAQQNCIEANKHRFKPENHQLNHFYASAGSGGPEADRPKLAEREAPSETASETPQPKHKSRTAVIIKTWWDYEYDAEDLFYLRAMVNELTLQSGGEFAVHFLVHVKDDNKQIWADEDVYQQVLNDSLPAEFRGMGTLWSERQMFLIYGGVEDTMFRDLPVHGVYRSTYMPVQYFAHMHPEYDFFWHWEMDIRYTGHFYDLFTKIPKWAKVQPRKGLWERNGRFYVPSEHGSWEDFRQLVRVQSEHGTASKSNMYGRLGEDAAGNHPLDKDSRRPDTPIWGPLRPSDDETADPEQDPKPTVSYEKDNYEWGVGEEADFITFNPLFDPSGTNWILAEDVTGYNRTNGFPPRRTAIITASRLSRRLLVTMHRETALQRHHMFSEMWPGSCALHHGYKAVYAPHPVYIDRAWPTSYLTAIFNNGRNGAAGGARTSVFSDERQVNFRGTTWYYDSGFAPNLWKRWLGYKVDNDGGEAYELANEGRMCLPPMLLHPVKHVDMIYEHQEGEKDA